MKKQSYDYGYRFSSEIISYAILSLPIRFKLSRRRRVNHRTEYHCNLRIRSGDGVENSGQPIGRLGDTWYLNEVFVTVQGRRPR